MRIIVKEVGKNPKVKEITNELRVLQEIVGGYIECFNVIDTILCVCNEEGKLIGLPPNFIFNGSVIVGDVFFCAAGDEDFESLNDDQLEFIMSDMFEIKM